LLRKYSHFLEDKLKGRKISQIIQNDLRNFFITLKNTTLTLSLSPEFPIIYLNGEKKNQRVESPFLLTLKKYLTGATIDSIVQLDFDRILSIHLSRLNILGSIETFTLQFELISKNPNLMLIDSSGKMIALYKSTALEEHNDRILLSNITYTPPKRSEKISPTMLSEESFNIFKENKSIVSSVDGIGKFGEKYCETFLLFQNYLTSEIQGFLNEKKKIASLFHFDSQGECVDVESLFEHYFNCVQSEDSVESTKQNYLKMIRILIKKQQKIISNITKDLTELNTLERDRELADILAANMYQLKPYMNEVVLFDFYHNCECTIHLDEKLSPQKNIDMYYRLYNQKSRAIKTLHERMENIHQNIQHFETLLLSIELISTAQDISDIQKELESLGIIQQEKAKGKKKNSEVSVIIEEYPDYFLYIGKNNLSNEKITFNLASKNDLWFHVQDIPSSHVILSMKNGLIPTHDAIIHAATMCKSFSKARSSLNVPIDYTEKKYVRKQKNYKPCLVFYTDFSTVII